MTRQLTYTASTCVGEVIDRILSSGQITRRDEQALLRAMHCDAPLSHAEISRIQQVQNRLYWGMLHIVE